MSQIRAIEHKINGDSFILSPFAIPFYDNTFIVVYGINQTSILIVISFNFGLKYNQYAILQG